MEFATIDEAKHWMMSRQGVLQLQDHYKATIHYSFQKHKYEEEQTDWYCESVEYLTSSAVKPASNAMQIGKIAPEKEVMKSVMC